jgi:hypothetical protein
LLITEEEAPRKMQSVGRVLVVECVLCLNYEMNYEQADRGKTHGREGDNTIG